MCRRFSILSGLLLGLRHTSALSLPLTGCIFQRCRRQYTRCKVRPLESRARVRSAVADAGRWWGGESETARIVLSTIPQIVVVRIDLVAQSGSNVHESTRLASSLSAELVSSPRGWSPYFGFCPALNVLSVAPSGQSKSARFCYFLRGPGIYSDAIL